MAKSYNSTNTNPIALQVPGNINTTELSSNLFQAFSQSFKVHIQLIKQAWLTKHIYLRGAPQTGGGERGEASLALNLVEQIVP